jgi:hypothetical protein
MPNYANTVIYEIICDGECYVGHTTNFERRKIQHKSRCLNETENFKLYVFIREHGEWENCEMSIIENYPCENKREAEMREEHWRVEKNAILNEKKAYITKEQIRQRDTIQQNIRYKNNREKINTQRKIRDEKNKDKINKQVKNWREKNKEHIQKQKQIWIEKNKDRVNELQRINYHKRKEQKALELIDSRGTTNSSSQGIDVATN